MMQNFIFKSIGILMAFSFITRLVETQANILKDELTSVNVISLLDYPSKTTSVDTQVVGGIVGSVVFNLTGPNNRNQNENTAPYALFGDTSSNYTGWSTGFQKGAYNLRVRAFTGTSGSGTLLHEQNYILLFVDNSIIYPLYGNLWGGTLTYQGKVYPNFPYVFRVRASNSPNNVGLMPNPSPYQTVVFPLSNTTTFDVYVPVQSGRRYNLKLMFSEIFHSSASINARIFDVYLDGVKIIDRLNIVAESGGTLYLDKIFTNRKSTRSYFHLHFATGGGVGVPTLAGIELEEYVNPCPNFRAVVTYVQGHNETGLGGIVEVGALGAVGELSYRWLHDNSLTGNRLENLSYGYYACEVTDTATGCKDVATGWVRNTLEFYWVAVYVTQVLDADTFKGQVHNLSTVNINIPNSEASFEYVNASPHTLTFRVKNIDAPETLQAFGSEATHYATDKLLNKVIWCYIEADRVVSLYSGVYKIKYDREKDKYGRYLAEPVVKPSNIVYTDFDMTEIGDSVQALFQFIFGGWGDFFEESLVRDGFAWVYTKFNQKGYLPSAQVKAQNEDAGLWSGNPVAPWKWRKLNK